MCRIAGIVSLRSDIDFEKGITSMLASLVHGGPDDEGTYYDNGVALGHRRLAIIDLSSDGHQPMISADAQLIISFNGEIYNYQSLGTELMEMGHEFKTKTDTEVILVAYKQWGVKAFDRFEGIFAFSLYDKKEKKIILIRDHIGIKPLYFFFNKEELIFASEVRAFKALRPDWQENADWKILLLAFGSIPRPFTTLQEVYQLEPGAYLELDLTTFVCDIKHYFTPVSVDSYLKTRHEALQLIHNASKDALRKNLISDAPLGIFLSGGIDSSLLTLMADRIQEKVKTISVNFKEVLYDERYYQDMVLQNTINVDHHSYFLTEQTFWDELENIWKAMDQPSIDGVNAYFVSQCAKKEGLKVVLSGLGADEIFGGYESINRIRWLKKIRTMPCKKWLGKILGFYRRSLKRLMFLNIPGAIGDYLFLRGIHTPDSIAAILNLPEEKIWQALRKVKMEMPETIDNKQYASFLEANIYMSNQLLKDTDFMSMWHGIEVRVPFLDIVLIRKTHQIEPSIRTMKGWPKYLLTASSDNILPHDIVFREKRGFTFPFSLWMRGNLSRISKMIPDNDAASKVMKGFENGKSHWSTCWSMVVINQFGRRSSEL